jgi:hypothetical protein
MIKLPNSSQVKIGVFLIAAALAGIILAGGKAAVTGAGNEDQVTALPLISTKNEHAALPSIILEATETPRPLDVLGPITIVLPETSSEPAPTQALPDTPGDSTANTPIDTPIPEPTGTTAEPTAPAASPTATATPVVRHSISGLLTVNGIPASEIFQLTLEDLNHNILAAAASTSDGAYVFNNITLSDQGYVLVYTNTDPNRVSFDDTISWGFLEPFYANSAETLWLPNFDLGYLGMQPLHPMPLASVSARGISAGSPLVFEWQPYPCQGEYWIDLARGDEQQLVWQSPMVEESILFFDGRLEDGTPIQPGEYWWALGVRCTYGSFHLTVYGYLTELEITP